MCCECIAATLIVTVTCVGDFTMRKLLVAAAAFGAMALSALSAGAVTINVVPITNGGTYTLAYNTVFTGGSTGLAGGPGSVVYGFHGSDLDPVHVRTGLTANVDPIGSISDLFIGWYADSGGATLLQTVFDGGPLLSSNGGGAVDSNFMTPWVTRYLIATWSGATGAPDIDVRVAAVPLPAGFLLMGTALAGLGAVSRRRRAKAA